MNRRRGAGGTGRVRAAVVGVLGVALGSTLALLPGGATAVAAGTAAGTAAGSTPGTGGAYGFDAGARRVKGAVSNLDAERLAEHTTYRDTLKKDGKLYYRVDLDDKRNAYVSAVAVPRPGARTGYGDGIKVSLQDGANSQCGYQERSFGSAEFGRPIAAYADRTLEPGSTTCRQAGAYYVLVERESAKESDQGDWELEIRFVTEPGVKKAGPTALPSEWPSGTPQPPTGGPRRRDGGSGFHDAIALTQGEWRTDIRPGQTLFYRVPVDWGQQLFATAQLGNNPASDEYLGNAFVLSLDNPAYGHVDQNTVTYDGDPATMALDAQRPVAFENRFSGSYSTGAMRFAGWYYLSATLSPAVAKHYGDQPLPLTLRVNITGQAAPGPAYDGAAGVFTVTDDDRDAAASGTSEPQEARGATYRVVGLAGIGAGTVLLLGLAVWWLLARRTAAATGPGTGTGARTGTTTA
ncbi:hypothetical protein [Streptomyces sp. NPDC090025]|uniref:hypothetical protein n=1 Tax=Streptomyces sp. NPDC090025 TaxID=3365922 RepID=UPI003832601B